MRGRQSYRETRLKETGMRVYETERKKRLMAFERDEACESVCVCVCLCVCVCVCVCVMAGEAYHVIARQARQGTVWVHQGQALAAAEM